jgi:serine/threonine-protein kinase RsbT
MMQTLKEEIHDVRAPEDIVRIRQRVRAWAVDIGFSLVDQTKIVTAASELARNTLEYGGGGKVRFRHMQNGMRQGLGMDFEDEGPGIANLELALKDGYSTGTGLGLGLSGSRRLMNEFHIDSAPGQGTRVRVARWK